jgi:hypothetical protein
MSYRAVAFRVKPVVIEALETNLAAEAAARVADISGVNSALSGEAAARVADISGVNSALSGEAAARSAADSVHNQALEILVGVSGALAVETAPASGVTFVYDGTLQTL